jgi:hypothetical protein
MGLWLKNEDGFVPVSGGGGAGGTAGPHDHDYLPLTGGTLTGDLTVDGTLAAETKVWFAGGTTGEIIQSKTSGRSILVVKPDATGNGPQLQLLGDSDPSNDAMAFKDASGNYLFRQLKDGLFWAYGDLRVSGDLHVDGAETKLTSRLTMRPSSDNGSSIDYLQKANNSNKWVTSGPRESDDNSFITYWYDGDWNRTLVLWKDRARFYGDLQVDGIIHANKTGAKGNPSINLGANGTGIYAAYHDTNGGKIRTTVNSNIVFEAEHDKVSVYTDLGVNGIITDKNGPVRSFATADGIDTADVLERAETATMPAPDDEGVATADADVESLTVNEVMTAMLAKIKELSAEIEELKAKDRPLKKQAAPRKKAATRKTTTKKEDS